jgi:endonuclease/exonuclease/phosphatase family metal-dependent hydrolase
MLEPMTRSRLILLAVVVTAGGQLGCDDDDLVGPGLPVAVYTRNLYLGSDLTPLILVGSAAEIPTAAAAIWANIEASDFPERAKILAEDIVAAAPDMVALQEVTLYRRQVPSDIVSGTTEPNADEVVLDFLALLMTEIDARGGGYRVVGEATNADAELPVADAEGGIYDLRLTDRDVILARDTAQSGYFNVDHFDAAFEFPVGGGDGVKLKTVRSVSWVDADVGGARFTFANTHLEIQSVLTTTIQVGQAVEMMNTLRAIPGPILLLGDLNSAPGETSYVLVDSRFDDAWPAARGTETGFTCCQAGDLLNPDSTAVSRIDLIWQLGRFRVNQAEVRGSDPAMGRTPSGLWASDHLGVSAHVELVP